MQPQQRATPSPAKLTDMQGLLIFKSVVNIHKGLQRTGVYNNTGWGFPYKTAQNLLKYDSRSQCEPCKQGCIIHIRHVSKTCFSLPSELAAFRALRFSSAQQSLKDTNYTDRGLHWLCAMTLVSKACCRGQWVTQAAVKAHNDSSVYQLKSSPSPFPTLIPAPHTILMATHGKKLQPGIPRTRVTVHPTCPAHLQFDQRHWQVLFSSHLGPFILPRSSATQGTWA